MSTLLSSALLISQLCYDPTQDIGDHLWLKKSQLFEQELTLAVKNKQAVCIKVHSEQQRKEAQYLANLDASRRTIIVK